MIHHKTYWHRFGAILVFLGLLVCQNAMAEDIFTAQYTRSIDYRWANSNGEGVVQNVGRALPFQSGKLRRKTPMIRWEWKKGGVREWNGWGLQWTGWNAANNLGSLFQSVASFNFMKMDEKSYDAYQKEAENLYLKSGFFFKQLIWEKQGRKSTATPKSGIKVKFDDLGGHPSNDVPIVPYVALMSGLWDANATPQTGTTAFNPEKNNSGFYPDSAFLMQIPLTAFDFPQGGVDLTRVKQVVFSVSPTGADIGEIYLFNICIEPGKTDGHTPVACRLNLALR